MAEIVQQNRSKIKTQTKMTTTRLHIAVELIEAIGEYLDGCGLSATEFYHQQGYNPDDDQHNGYVDFQRFSQLFDAAAAFSGDDYIGLKVGENFLARHWGRLGYLIMAGENGLEGIQFIQRFASIVTNALQMQWQMDSTTLSCEFSLLEPVVSRHVIDYFVSSSLSLSRATSQNQASYLSVHFQHDGGPQPAFYDHFLQTQCFFNQSCNRITVALDSLRQLSVLRDPRLKQILEEHADQVLQSLAAGDELVQAVHRYIVDNLAHGAPTLKQTCEFLGQNERSLQRALAKQGINFQDMVDDLRRRMALEYMRNDYNFLDIAMMLGYSEQSALHRAFKRWTGMPPSRYRRTLLQDAAGEQPVADKKRPGEEPGA